jgi:DNA-binding PucR family transcriptional regulator
LPPGVSLAIGEPGESLSGWRLTHQQARAALPIALRSPEGLVRYADVALLASTLQDDLLSTSLRQLYLVPLEQERDGGETLRETLRAYFAAERNVSSAAAALGVSRQAVNSRLRTIEEKLGRPLGGCAAELETALSMEQVNGLDGMSSPSQGSLSH